MLSFVVMTQLLDRDKRHILDTFYLKLLGSMEIARLHVVIEGNVQGVFFRASTREESCKLGLTGWVKNCPDGRVEAIFEGDTDKIDQMIQWYKKGPPGATVSNVETVREQATGEFDSFTIKY